VAAYVIYQGEVLDPERYEEYEVKATHSCGSRVSVFGARDAVRGATGGHE
jgi:hypothetical protein